MPLQHETTGERVCNRARPTSRCYSAGDGLRNQFDRNGRGKRNKKRIIPDGISVNTAGDKIRESYFHKIKPTSVLTTAYIDNNNYTRACVYVYSNRG